MIAQKRSNISEILSKIAFNFEYEIDSAEDEYNQRVNFFTNGTFYQLIIVDDLYVLSIGNSLENFRVMFETKDIDKLNLMLSKIEHYRTVRAVKCRSLSYQANSVQNKTIEIDSIYQITDSNNGKLSILAGNNRTISARMVNEKKLLWQNDGYEDVSAFFEFV